MSIREINHVQVTIPIGMELVAKKFYCGFLGLLELKKPQSLLDNGGFWLEVGALQVHVGCEDCDCRSLTKAHIAYGVVELDAWRKKLTHIGIEYEDGIAIEGFDRLSFRDPFGNKIELMDRIA